MDSDRMEEANNLIKKLARMLRTLEQESSVNRRPFIRAALNRTEAFLGDDGRLKRDEDDY